MYRSLLKDQTSLPNTGGPFWLLQLRAKCHLWFYFWDMPYYKILNPLINPHIPSEYNSFFWIYFQWFYNYKLNHNHSNNALLSSLDQHSKWLQEIHYFLLTFKKMMNFYHFGKKFFQSTTCLLDIRNKCLSVFLSISFSS
jgi:hypothetical protein